MGFEPTELLHSTVFKTVAFNRSAIPPFYVFVRNQRPLVNKYRHGKGGGRPGCLSPGRQIPTRRPAFPPGAAYSYPLAKPWRIIFPNLIRVLTVGVSSYKMSQWVGGDRIRTGGMHSPQDHPGDLSRQVGKRAICLIFPPPPGPNRKKKMDHPPPDTLMENRYCPKASAFKPGPAGVDLSPAHRSRVCFFTNPGCWPGIAH